VVITTKNLGGLGPTGSNSSEAWGVSPSGGYVAGDSTIDNFHGHATLWTNQVITDLGLLGGRYSVAKGVNDSGQAVGCTDTPTPGATVPFVWGNGTMMPLPVSMDGMENCAVSINSAGVIVGQIDVPTEQGEIFTHAAMWQNGVLIDLNTVLHSLVPAGTVVTTASSITDSGRFLVAVDSTSSSAFYLVTPVNPTQVALTTSANPSFLGDNVTFTAHVTSAGHGTLSGTVTFKDGSTTLSKVALDLRGAATFTTGSLTLGTHSIVAHYATNDVYGASDSPVLAQRVIFKLIPIPR
jgi:probable HAF family extracellular repeat protein